ncbi:hypothetical protein IAE35_22955 [Pseudomonas sp. S75]|uniref:hypothetical protein n=1 Tax=unclassified Pseudomonas TaxID=196821 RepID=UPI001906FF15|nr:MULTISPECIES: hypothetical protein [unclassified Pseudomonas]MBJ9977210.1 hypothetical protein [Pseudomonas sp. S30]MBK0156211.1 hypothetical protein [Pseudomonas sp. S75]
MNIIKLLRSCTAYTSLLTLSGCALMGSGAPTLNDLYAEHQLKGADIKEAYRKIGPPDQVGKLPNGLSVAKWDDAYSYTYVSQVNQLSAGPGGSTMVTPTEYTSVTNHECILSLTFNAQNIVINVATQKTDPGACSRIYSGHR